MPRSTRARGRLELPRRAARLAVPPSLTDLPSCPEPGEIARHRVYAASALALRPKSLPRHRQDTLPPIQHAQAARGAPPGPQMLAGPPWPPAAAEGGAPARPEQAWPAPAPWGTADQALQELQGPPAAAAWHGGTPWMAPISAGSAPLAPQLPPHTGESGCMAR